MKQLNLLVIFTSLTIHQKEVIQRTLQDMLVMNETARETRSIVYLRCYKQFVKKKELRIRNNDFNIKNVIISLLLIQEE